MWVDIEDRSDGRPLRVWVAAKSPKTALVRALEENPGPGKATIQGKRNMFARSLSDGTVKLYEMAVAA